MQRADICRDYAAKDERIRYHCNEENIGVNPNFNLLADRCETPFFKWAAGDDYLAPTMLEKTMAEITSNPSIAICYPKTTLVNSVDGTESLYDDNLHLMQDDPTERFTGVLNNIQLCNVTQAILRTELLRKVKNLQAYPGADLVFVSELALYGKICEVPEYLFYRRLHEESSSWARGDSTHQARRFHAAKPKGTTLNRWRAKVGYFRAVTKAPLKLSQKLKVYFFLLKRIVRHRRMLAAEIWTKVTGR